MIPNESMAKIRSLADEVSRREGCRLYDLEFSGTAKSRILRVYIDQDKTAVQPASIMTSADASGGSLDVEKDSGQGVTVEQCANVSRGLSLLLDVQDLVPGGFYELEVSSPGIERPLREPWHFAGAIQQMAKVVTHDPVEDLKGEVRSLQGRILSADDTAFEMEYNEGKARIPFQNVKRAQVIFSFTKNERKK